MAQEKAPPSPSQDLTLGWVRDALVRQEDSIVFALIERARFPYNAPTYNPSLFPQLGGRSLVEVFVRGAEGLQAKVPSSSSFRVLRFRAEILCVFCMIANARLLIRSFCLLGYCST